MQVPVSRVKTRLVPSRVSKAWRELSSWLAGTDEEYGPGTRERLLNGLVRHPEDSIEDALDAATGVSARLAEEILPRADRGLKTDAELRSPPLLTQQKEGIKAA